MAPLAADPLIGVTLDGKYLVVERIGVGGMGTVYRAVHESLGAARAIKVMKRELAEDAAFVARFQNEARLAEGLRHPHLVALYDFARLGDGTWYIVSEFVLGETLAALLAKGVRFPSSEVAHYVGQLADGMALAHRQGIVHRDISPDNIMITRDQEGERIAKLLDFGIAKSVRGESAKTGSGLLFGKIGYASPEQMGLVPGGELDNRSDVFSLTAVAFEMLTGRLPWRKDSMQSYVHDLLMRPEAEVIQALRSGTPAEWGAAFERGLVRDRERRTPSMQALKADLSEAAQRLTRAEEGASRTRTMPGAVQPKDSTWRKGAGPVSRPASGRLWPAAALAVIVVGVVLALLARDKPTGPPASPASRLGVVASRAPESPAPVPNPQKADAPAPARRAESTPRPSPRIVPTPLPSVGPAAASASPPPAEPGPVQPGALVLRSTPLAVVMVDGETLGRTPLDLTALAAGRHQLVLTTSDGRIYQETITIAAGETLERNHRFPGFGSLSVTADVWLEVSVDGGPPQQTPFLVDRLVAGRHVLRAFRSGYREKTLEIEIREGETSRVPIALERQ